MRLLDLVTGTKRPEAGVEPAPPDAVRQALLGVNRPDVPYAVREATEDEGAELVGEWKLVDLEWRDIFAHGGISKMYRVLMRLDPKKSEVRTIDKEWSVSWQNGVPELSRNFLQARGQLSQTERGVAYGVDEHGMPAQLYNYDFRTKDLKEPLRAAVTGQGWVWHALVFVNP
jgi:hypothetical protein